MGREGVKSERKDEVYRSYTCFETIIPHEETRLTIKVITEILLVLIGYVEILYR